jgi:hypothetical protein
MMLCTSEDRGKQDMLRVVGEQKDTISMNDMYTSAAMMERSP